MPKAPDVAGGPGRSRVRHDGPPCPGRRSVLLGLGAAGGTALGLPAVAAPGGDDRPALEDDGTRQRQAFYGPHQSGVTTPQPAAALVASFDVLGETRADLIRLMRGLTRRIAFLMEGGAVPLEDTRLPPPDSGLLGPTVIPDNLTVTAAFGSSLFDGRFGLADRKPKYLAAMPRFPNDALDPARCHGDLLLQFNANTAETNIHALRDVLKHFPDLVAVRWKMDGFLPPRMLKKQGRDTARNLLGFKDGTANLDSRDDALMDRVVWIGAASDEPAWARGGTYQAVRVIRMLVERWDRTPLGEQQTIIGRDKAEGAPLGKARERDDPDFANDPDGQGVPLGAHIRRANPRLPGSDANLILRRAYNFSDGITKAGQLDMGLLFTAFQADLDAGFATVQGRLDGEPLEEYIKPVGGGYFFTLPGVRKTSGYLGDALLEPGT